MKRQIMSLAGVLALAAAPLTGPALAQTAGSSGATMPFVAQQPADEWLARVFIGQAVYNVAGEAIGDVNDLVFNPFLVHGHPLLLQPNLYIRLSMTIYTK